MKIGDILTIKPNFYTEYMGANDQPRQAQVIYIHPEGRFYVVEFRSDLGIPWRETFFPYTRRIEGGLRWPMQFDGFLLPCTG